MQDPHDAIQSFSSENQPTLYKTFACMEMLQARWTELASEERMEPLCEPINAGLGNLKKWYKSMDNTDAHIVALCACLLSHRKAEY